MSLLCNTVLTQERIQYFFKRGGENFHHYEINRLFIPSEICVIGRGPIGLPRVLRRFRFTKTWHGLRTTYSNPEDVDAYIPNHFPHTYTIADFKLFINNSIRPLILSCISRYYLQSIFNMAFNNIKVF
jgi:hypothetical protein